ncbi:universal stress protein [Empedobacter falsenii]|uniref:universal stress protein n=1 Tax=Empedobacter falsenii TaxID=343874 RepID=UPI001C595ADD|nr:universal stress protein [Empedobacter falsenii]MBW1619019.1 universal stress protein [Empedobacter falsenii]
MKKILFLTDFSKVAQNAFVYALSVAEKTKAEIHILHITAIMEAKDEVEEMQVHAMANAYKNNLEKEEWGKFRAEAGKLEKIAKEYHQKDVPVEFHLENGPFLEVVLNYIDDNDISLLIMGTSGANTVDKKLFGSNTENLINNCSIPILAIPEKATFVNSNSLSVAVMLNDTEIPIIKRLFEKTAQYGYKINFVHIIKSIEETEMVKAKVDKWLVNFKENNLIIDVINKENIEIGLMEYAYNTNTQILSIIHRDLSFWQRIFKINHSKNLLQYSDIALLIYNNNTIYNN